MLTSTQVVETSVTTTDKQSLISGLHSPGRSNYTITKYIPIDRPIFWVGARCIIVGFNIKVFCMWPEQKYLQKSANRILLCLNRDNSAAESKNVYKDLRIEYLHIWMETTVQPKAKMSIKNQRIETTESKNVYQNLLIIQNHKPVLFLSWRHVYTDGLEWQAAWVSKKSQSKKCL